MSNRRIKKNNLKRKKFCKKVAFGSRIVIKVYNTLRNLGGNRLITYGRKKASDIALKVARKHLKSVGGKRHIRTPRVIPIPKVGGLLSLLPIFAELSALGSLASVAAGINKAVQTANSSREQLEEANRHNKIMEAIAIGKSGNWIYLKSYRKSLGLYFNSEDYYRQVKK